MPAIFAMSASIVNGLLMMGWTLKPCGLLLISSFAVMVVAYLYDLALALISPNNITFYF